MGTGELNGCPMVVVLVIKIKNKEKKKVKRSQFGKTVLTLLE